MNYSFSFIIAVYNCQKYIKRCIESVLQQQNSNFELIIVDDGSSDKTAIICDEYKNIENVKVIHQSNQGHTVARLRGLQEAQGEYVCILDADDWVSENYLEKIDGVLTQFGNHPDVISFNYNRIDQDGREQPVVSEIVSGQYNKRQLTQKIYPIMLSNQSKEFFSFGVYPTLWSKIFKNNLITEVMELLDPDVVLGEDAFCVFLSLYRASSVIFLDECLYNYQINSASLSQKYAKDNFEKLTSLCMALDRFYPSELLDQVRSYKLSMLMGAITNETRGPKSSRWIIKTLKERCALQTFSDCIWNSAIPHMSIIRKAVLGMLRYNLYGLLVYVLRITKA